MEIIFILISLYVIFWQANLIVASIWGAPSVFANDKAILDALKMANPQRGQLVLDLGCGDARSLIISAKEFGTEGVGIERSPYCWIKANILVKVSGQSDKIKILFGDFKTAEAYLGKSDVIYLYLLEKVLAEKENWIFDHISKSTKIVSLSFKFKKHLPVDSISTRNLHRMTNVYLYRR